MRGRQLTLGFEDSHFLLLVCDGISEGDFPNPDAAGPELVQDASRCRFCLSLEASFVCHCRSSGMLLLGCALARFLSSAGQRRSRIGQISFDQDLR